MSQSAEQLCAEIERLQLMPASDFAAMKARWFRPDRKDASDRATFANWLQVNHYLTPFLVNALEAGQGDKLVLNQYRLRDQLKTGPLAGAYVATDPLQRPVLVQIVSGKVLTDPARRRFLEEVGEKLIALKSPHVSRVIDQGEAHGMRYIVREHEEAETLSGILQKRGKLPYGQAARIFALACEGLQALHERGLPGGALTADCVLLAVTAKGPKAPRTVKLLLASLQRDVFDANAIGSSGGDIPDNLELAALPEEEGGATRPPRPDEDIFRLGCLFYRTLTGRDPFTDDQIPLPHHPARPLSEARPEVPSMLADIVERMIEPDPAKRWTSGGHVAKALRVFLKTEEQEKEAPAEEQVEMPAPAHAPRKVETPADYEEVEEDDDEDLPVRRPRKRPAAAAEEESRPLEKLQALWDDYRPETRDLVFLGLGGLGMVVAILLVQLLTGIRFVDVALLAIGAALSYVVERLLRWREARQEMAD